MTRGRGPCQRTATPVSVQPCRENCVAATFSVQGGPRRFIAEHSGPPDSFTIPAAARNRRPPSAVVRAESWRRRCSGARWARDPAGRWNADEESTTAAQANESPGAYGVQIRKSCPDPVPRFLIPFWIAYRYQARLFLMIVMTAKIPHRIPAIPPTRIIVRASSDGSTFLYCQPSVRYQMVLGQMIEQTLAMMIRRTAAIGSIIFTVIALIPA